MFVLPVILIGRIFGAGVIFRDEGASWLANPTLQYTMGFFRWVEEYWKPMGVQNITAFHFDHLDIDPPIHARTSIYSGGIKISYISWIPSYNRNKLSC